LTGTTKKDPVRDQGQGDYTTTRKRPTEKPKLGGGGQKTPKAKKRKKKEMETKIPIERLVPWVSGLKAFQR